MREGEGFFPRHFNHLVFKDRISGVKARYRDQLTWMATMAIHAHLDYATLLGPSGKVPISLEEFQRMNTELLVALQVIREACRASSTIASAASPESATFEKVKALAGQALRKLSS